MAGDTAAARAADLALALRAALAGAAVGLEYFARVTQLTREWKDDGTVVTAGDRAVEGTVREILLAARPADASLGEETGAVGGGRRRWILDGIDGTATFVTGDSRWQTLIALEEDGAIVVGVAIVPAQGRVWWASRGGGAFVADIAGEAPGPARRLAVRGAPAGRAPARLGVIPQVADLPAAYRDAIGPLAALAPPADWSVHPALLVAAGDVDCALQMGGEIWDYASLALIVEEAGGAFRRTTAGHPAVSLTLFASTAELRDAALARLGAARGDDGAAGRAR